jgi:mannosyl-3-phosphoglycerate phosphatase
MSRALRIVLFTDLDGSLLDAETYSFEGARPALQELRRRSIPIVACTSKTAAETRHVLRRLEEDAPFIVESGAGVYLPERIFAGLGPEGERRDGCRLVKLASGYDEVLGGMAEIRQRFRGGVRGFHDMTPEEIARETGLSIEMAKLAKGREFDEPFRLEGDLPSGVEDLDAIAAARGLRLSRGGRFWHLHGDTDKGRAVDLVASLYEELWGTVKTIGAGDSAMDLSLLVAVDIGVIVAKPDGGYDPVLMERVQTPVLSERSGPEGWSRGVLRALDLIDR